MATTKSWRVGRTRIRLAKILSATVPGLTVHPEDLWSQIPVYASAKWDCCSWGGTGYRNGMRVDLASWDTMRACVQRGVDYTIGGRNAYTNVEISAKSKVKNEPKSK